MIYLAIFIIIYELVGTIPFSLKMTFLVFL